jgi:glyoxylase-like metal-dependent hydrolase (beta-lactamase superfamily II)
VQIAEGVIAHPLPGHTEGSVLYLADDTYCFSGDSFYWSRTTGDLAVAESVTWYSITELAAPHASPRNRSTSPRCAGDAALRQIALTRARMRLSAGQCPIDSVQNDCYK